jgi:hypothetical protein
MVAGCFQTFIANHQCTDSAGGASTILSGQKANYATVGVNSNVIRYDCESQEGNEIDTILKWSQDAGEGQGEMERERGRERGRTRRQNQYGQSRGHERRVKQTTR